MKTILRTLLLAALPLVLVCVRERTAIAQQPRPARIDFEVITDGGGAPTAAQEWYQTLTALKVDNLRLRGATSGDEPKVEAVGTPSAPAYKVIGLLNRSGDLIVPGGKFRANDRAGVAQWITKLRDEGPVRAGGGPRLPYGLTKEQFGEVYEDLSRPIQFATQGMKPDDFVNRAADAIKLPLTGSGVAAAHLRAARPLDVDLQGLSAGTAIAFVLHNANLALVPVQDPQRHVALQIEPARPQQERWPIGWAPQVPKRDLLPKIYDLVDAELKDVEAPRVIGAVDEHVSAPILFDHLQLDRDKIDLSTIKVNMPAKRVTYDALLRKVFVPHGMAHDVRVDEADKPVIWVTTTRAAEQQARDKEPPR